jgi:hypothetical protein
MHPGQVVTQFFPHELPTVRTAVMMRHIIHVLASERVPFVEPPPSALAVSPALDILVRIYTRHTCAAHHAHIVEGPARSDTDHMPAGCPLLRRRCSPTPAGPISQGAARPLHAECAAGASGTRGVQYPVGFSHGALLCLQGWRAARAGASACDGLCGARPVQAGATPAGVAHTPHTRAGR